MFRWLKTQKRLEEAEESLRDLDRTIKKLELEWTDTYEKFRNLSLRVAKRVKTLEDAEPAPPTGEEIQQTPSAEDNLTPAQRAANQRILARRHRMILRPNGGE
jgi:hypothetical protein